MYVCVIIYIYLNLCIMGSCNELLISVFDEKHDSIGNKYNYIGLVKATYILR